MLSSCAMIFLTRATEAGKQLASKRVPADTYGVKMTSQLPLLEEQLEHYCKA